jgi:hypothetical protein
LTVAARSLDRATHVKEKPLAAAAGAIRQLQNFSGSDPFTLTVALGAGARIELANGQIIVTLSSKLVGRLAGPPLT